MWVYHQKTGLLIDPDNKVAGQGYAGNGEGKNNPDFERVPKVGPLPKGFYTIGKPFDDEHLGKFVLPLHPHEDNVMFGRDGFYMHGDSITNPGNASEGCIVQPPITRHRVANSPDSLLQVVE